MRRMVMNPYWNIKSMADEFEKFRRAFAEAPYPARGERQRFYPPVDIRESETEMTFEFEVPGVNKDEVKISVNDENILSIKGTKKFAKEEVKSCCRNERTYGDFHRTFYLPDNLDFEKIKAEHKNGVLTVSVPKKEPEKPKEKNIEIN